MELKRFGGAPKGFPFSPLLVPAFTGYEMRVSALLLDPTTGI
jgi:hypothetical protein